MVEHQTLPILISVFHLQHVSGISIKYENMKRNLVKFAIVQWTDGRMRKKGRKSHPSLSFRPP